MLPILIQHCGNILSYNIKLYNNDKTVKKRKNKVFRYEFNDKMLGVQYSFHKMEVTFSLCKGLTQPY